MTTHKIGTYATSLKICNVRSNDTNTYWEVDVDAHETVDTPNGLRIPCSATYRLGTGGFDNVKDAEHFIFNHLGFVPNLANRI